MQAHLRYASGFLATIAALAGAAEPAQRSYPLAPTGQRTCHDADGTVMACHQQGSPLAGQDAAHAVQPLRYRDNGDGTVSDLNTGLMWQQALPAKVTWAQARTGASTLTLGGHADWRLPSLKELYSLMDFSGSTPMPGRAGTPFLSPLFAFRYGEASQGERAIDVQFWSATPYVGRAMNRDNMIFGVNFADGRIKAYPSVKPDGAEHRLFVRYVRGNSHYGQNQFQAHVQANGDATVTDHATGLMWMQVDSGHLKAGPQRDGRMNWPQALAWAQGLNYAGYDDWRLPNAKELQSLVDYSRSPQTTGSAAIDPLFKSTPVTDEGGKSNYGFYWSSTSHFDGAHPGSAAVYVAFGDALGFMRLPPSASQPRLLDVHGAGAQRSDPKVGNAADYPMGWGPQGDVRRIANLVRVVRDAR